MSVPVRSIQSSINPSTVCSTSSPVVLDDVAPHADHRRVVDRWFAVLTTDLPGTPAEAVDISVAGRTLTIAVNSEQITWERSLRLGAALDAEQVSARYVDGRLTVTIAPVPTAEPRRIEVSTEAPAIASTTVDAQAETPTSDKA